MIEDFEVNKVFFNIFEEITLTLINRIILYLTFLIL